MQHLVTFNQQSEVNIGFSNKISICSACLFSSSFTPCSGIKISPLHSLFNFGSKFHIVDLKPSSDWRSTKQETFRRLLHPQTKPQEDATPPTLWTLTVDATRTDLQPLMLSFWLPDIRVIIILRQISSVQSLSGTHLHVQILKQRTSPGNSIDL